MNRKEALEDFKSRYAIPYSIKARRRFHQLFCEKKEAMEGKLLQAFKEMVNYVKYEYKEEEMAFFLISYLRGHVADGSYLWYIEAQKEEGYLEEEERALVIDMSEFFLPLEELQERLSEELYRYVGKVTPYDVTHIKQNEYQKLLPYLYLLVLHTYRGLREYPSYSQLKLSKLFRIIFGEYKGKGQIVFLEDHMISEEELLKELTRKEEPHKDMEESLKKDRNEINKNQIDEKAIDEDQKKIDETLTRRDYTSMTFCSLTIMMKNIYYSTFRNNIIKKTIFLFCNMIGSDFSNTKIEDSYFQICTLINATFEHAVIKRTGFAGSHFESGGYDKRMRKGLYAVSFRNAVLDHVDFSCADLSGCDFRGAIFHNVLFKETKIEGTLFDDEIKMQIRKTKEEAYLVTGSMEEMEI